MQKVSEPLDFAAGNVEKHKENAQEGNSC